MILTVLVNFASSSVHRPQSPDRISFLWVVVAVAILAVGCGPGTKSSTELPISFRGEHRFKIGDHPQWADPAFDDSAWELIRIPGSWQSQGAGTVCDVGWYRIRFQAPAQIPSGELAISLGFVGNTSEVYLNGSLIGAIGSVDPVHPPGNRTLHAHVLPPRLLSPGSTNLIAVRTLNVVGNGGILSGPIGIGGAAELQALGRELPRVRLLVLGCICALLSAATVLFIIVALRSERSRFAFWAIAFAGSGALTYANTIVMDAGFGPIDLWMRTIWILALFSMMAILHLTVALHGLPFTRLLWIMDGLFIVAMGASAAWATDLTRYRLATNVYSAAYAGFVLCMIGACAWGWARAKPFARTLTAGFLALILCSMPDAFASTWAGYDYATAPISGVDLGVLTLTGIVGVVVFARYLANLDRLRVLGGQILREREEERRRLARDLHDGLGQSLQAMKMALQIEGSRSPDGNKAGALNHDELADQLSDRIKELRLLAREMHPALSEEANVIHSFESYARELRRQFGVEIAIAAPETAGDWPGEVASQCYLIFKEAVGNAIRHGKAKWIDVRFAQEDGCLAMTVKDDGQGFDSTAADPTGGLGLKSIRERALLLGGACRIQSVASQGTEIEVELPLHAG